MTTPALDIERPAAKIAALERRAEWLISRIRDRSPTDKSRTFDQAELAALEAGILAIRCVSTMRREAFIESFKDIAAERNPVLALDELQNAIAAWMNATDESDDSTESRLQAAQMRAAKVLSAFAD